MLRWYLINTKPSGETVAQQNLERQGYEVYLPRLLESVRRGGCLRERIVPLFPRYLFLHLNEGSQALSPVRSSVGVLEVVRFGSAYALVPDRVIRDLQARANAESGLHQVARAPVLARGDSVAITQGPFDGLDGVFERQAGPDRVVVLLRLLGQAAPVHIPLDFVMRSRAA